MKIIVVIDEENGLMFDHRRLSRDRILSGYIASLTKNETLWMNGYTSGLFDPLPDNAKVEEDFLAKAGQNDWCFVEDQKLEPYEDEIDEMLLFHWNRRYPSDLKLDLVPDQNGFTCTDTGELAGSSHAAITWEDWKKNA